MNLLNNKQLIHLNLLVYQQVHSSELNEMIDHDSKGT